MVAPVYHCDDPLFKQAYYGENYVVCHSLNFHPMVEIGKAGALLFIVEGPYPLKKRYDGSFCR